MIPDQYSGTFYSLITKFKKKHNILSDDQAEYYFESLFVLAVQAIFCFSILGDIDWQQVQQYERSFSLNLVLFFTSFVLHFASIATIRNGIQMCRFTVFHYDQFQHPLAAFTLGLLVIFVNILCELTNTIYTLTQTSAIDVITKFIGFMCLIQSQDFYARQRANFSIKKEVGASPLIIIEDLSKIFGKDYKKKK